MRGMSSPPLHTTAQRRGQRPGVEYEFESAEPARGGAVDRLLAVGHSSGRHLLDGVLHVLSTHPSSHSSARQGAA